MSTKHFMSYGDAESVLTGYANNIKERMTYADNGVLGAKNRWNFPAWKNVGKSDATATWDDATYTLTLTATADYGRTNITVPDEAQISVVPNERIKFVWDSTGSDSDTTITFDVFKMEDTSSVFATASIHDNELLMTVPANCYKLTYRVMINNSGKVAKLANCMCILATDTDTTYQPYAMTNKELTERIKTTMTGATALADGASGLVPAPAAGDQNKALLGNGSWGDISTNLAGLSDVEITNLQDGQMLQYDATSQKWINDYINGLVSWSAGTDAEIAAMVRAFYEGDITLKQIQKYWHVGDVREMDISAIETTGTANGFTWEVGESHHAQTVDVVILGFEHDDLTTAVNGHTKALVSVGLLNCLYMGANKPTSESTDGSSNTENGYMNSSNTNVGGWTNCARRQWCNGGFYSAMPSEIQGTIKQVQKQTTAGNRSTTINTDNDYVFLPSEYEVFGIVSHAEAQEGNQYSYYTTAANRYKYPKWTSSTVTSDWWQRSPSDSAYFSDHNTIGNSSRSNASDTLGLAPMWAM